MSRYHESSSKSRNSISDRKESAIMKANLGVAKKKEKIPFSFLFCLRKEQGNFSVLFVVPVMMKTDTL